MGQNLYFREFAYAKTNLLLSVGPKDRTTDRHVLESLYVRLELADLVELNISEVLPGEHAETTIDVILSPAIVDHVLASGHSPEIIKNLLASKSNLIFKTIELFKSKYEVRCGNFTSKVKLTKFIPLEAGLGGGSADAAVTLSALGKKFNISDTDLKDLAKEIGADVFPCMITAPSFEYGYPSSHFRLSSNTKLSDEYVLLVKPPIGSNTKKAFMSLNRCFLQGDFKRQPEVCDALSNLKRIYDFNLPEVIFENQHLNQTTDKTFILNDFEEFIFNELPELRKAKVFFESKGCSLCFLSGSGSTLVTTFKSSNDLHKCVFEFQKDFGPTWWLEKTKFLIS